MVKLDTEGYGLCNTIIGDSVTSVETSVASYVTEVDTFLSNNQLGDNRMLQVQEIQEFIKTTVQGSLQTIEAEKNAVLAEFIIKEEETDQFS